ncbi:uncharacterized protein I303_108481 [Kwoniella dejecticola CBS 10117]|uniref:THO complex subunit 1 n=1 Tax=Kwoniella dejecticola CBS 10117 TaxID=1296121 RepID=A0A1A5ZXA5_9TREE|nr:uncharacterized protein I303_07197 [Kwoniella dejecticola CBS 10117]OBR82437.1 hypothetical protein I303_07197 [Kwoniella dejecticola CBS 10117]
MASALYPALKSSLTDVVNSHPPNRQLTKPIEPSELTTQLTQAWNDPSASLNASESSSKAGDVIRTVLEVVGRDVVVLPITSGELAEPDTDATSEEKQAFQISLQDRLDIILTLYEIVYDAFPDMPALEPGALFIPLIEELVELISVESWRGLWTYIETRSKRFTKDMPASRGKALPLLRTINAFLRFLPRTPDDLVFRGRVHQFASSVISVADKSAINMRGDYAEVRTTWDEEEPKVEVEAPKEDQVEQDGEGDVKMEDERDKPQTEAEEKAKEDKLDFYPTLWSLQQYFAHPPSLDGPATGDPAKTPFESFKEKTDFVLPHLFAQTQKEKALMGKDAESVGKKRKRSTEDVGEGGFFHPRYLTGKRLFEYELADPSFRRQILVQYFILFQFLLNLTPASAGKQAFTGGMPETFVLITEDEDWVKAKVSTIRDELLRMTDGKRFEETVLSIITREVHYAQWKNDQCPESVFEIPPLDESTAKEAAKLWEKRLAPPKPYTFKVGSRPLSMLWHNGFKGIDQLMGRQKATDVEQLDKELQSIIADEEDDKAMGIETASEKLSANKERKSSLTWRGLRLASQNHLKLFKALGSKRDLHVLMNAVKGESEPKGPVVENQAEEEKIEEAAQEKEVADVAGEADADDKPNEEAEPVTEVAPTIEAEEKSNAENANDVKAEDVDMEDPAEDEKTDDPVPIDEASTTAEVSTPVDAPELESQGDETLEANVDAAVDPASEAANIQST